MIILCFSLLSFNKTTNYAIKQSMFLYTGSNPGCSGAQLWYSSNTHLDLGTMDGWRWGKVKQEARWFNRMGGLRGDWSIECKQLCSLLTVKLWILDGWSSRRWEEDHCKTNMSHARRWLSSTESISSGIVVFGWFVYLSYSVFKWKDFLKTFSIWFCCIWTWFVVRMLEVKR